jgi:hypothetical protein
MSEDLAQEALSLVIVSLAVSTVSMTMTKAKISKPLREYIKSRNAWLHGLFSCPYCFGHWVSFVAVLAVRPVVTNSGFLPLDLLISALAVTALAAIGSGWIFRAIAAIPE